MQNNSRSRLDAYEKVTGKALYADDMTFPGMLYASAVHSPYPSAEILSIDTSRALEVEGVVGVYIAADCPGVVGDKFEKPVIAERYVRSIGDGVALVAAETEQAAIEAAKLVEVTYKELPALFDAQKALGKDAHLVHGDTCDSNLICVQEVERNDVQIGFEKSDIIVERTYSTPRHHHGAIEPDAVIVVPQDGGLTVYCCTKGIFNVKAALQAITGLPDDKMRLVHTTMGGTFGGKETDTGIVAGRACIVAMKTGRPCKLVWTREECMIEGTKRHPFFYTYKIGAKRDGTILAVEVCGIADGGAYKSKTPNVLRRAVVEALGPYNVEHVKICMKGVYTNNVICDTVRGLGSPQIYFGIDSTLNELAKELDISPFELRKKNTLKDGDTYATGQVLYNVGIDPCLDRLSEVFDCTPVKDKIRGDKAYGRGIGCQIRGESHGSGAPDICGVDLRVSNDGKIVIYPSIAEMGQGTHTAIAMVACELLGLDWERFSIGEVDTDISPMSTGTTASRGTISGANAVRLAVIDLIEKLSDVLAKKLNIPAKDISYKHGCFEVNSAKFTFDEVVSLAYEQGIKPLGSGSFDPPKTYWDAKKKQGDAYYAYSYGAAGAEVEIDLVTGKVEVLNLVCLHDLGKVINYPGARGQLEGGAVMALGHCLSEELECSNGRVKTDNFNSYLMPTCMDIHELTGYPESLVPAANPMGVHGVGEGSTVLAGVVIANAVEDALGVRIYDLPMNLERVRAAIEESRNKNKPAGR